MAKDEIHGEVDDDIEAEVKQCNWSLTVVGLRSA